MLDPQREAQNSLFHPPPTTPRDSLAPPPYPEVVLGLYLQLGGFILECFKQVTFCYVSTIYNRILFIDYNRIAELRFPKK